MAGRREALTLYRRFLRASGAFGDAGLREFVRARARHGFEEGRGAAPKEVPALLANAREQLDIVERKVAVLRLFGAMHHPHHHAEREYAA
mmetsp:Transcript_15444/g.43757  ORF Transcript_15444/g.43757 Transcript_15444/m.43757 type:complete len:90 (-) Transcript_15444:99-368(-)